MKYSQEQIEKIENWASIYLPIGDMAVLLDLPAEKLREDIRDASSEAGRAYRRGKTAAKVTLREQEMKLARIGSPLALENTQRNLLDMEDDE